MRFSLYLEKQYFLLPKFGTLNLHGGKLPQFRGGSPINWQIIQGRNKIGLSVIKVNKGIDSGEIASEKLFLLKKSNC